MKSSVYEGNKRALVATIMLIVLLFAASYAYFSDLNSANLSYYSSISNMANVSLSYTDGIDMVMEIDPLSAESKETSNPSQLLINLSNDSEYEKVSCKYELWYEPNSVFTKSAGNTSNQIEYSITISNGVMSSEKDLTGVSEPIKIYESRVEDSNLANDVSMVWTLNMNFYSLSNVDQSQHLGKSYQGRVFVKTSGCESDVITLSDTILSNVSDTEYTSSQDGTPYIIKHETAVGPATNATYTKVNNFGTTKVYSASNYYAVSGTDATGKLTMAADGTWANNGTVTNTYYHAVMPISEEGYYEICYTLGTGNTNNKLQAFITDSANSTVGTNVSLGGEDNMAATANNAKSGCTYVGYLTNEKAVRIVNRAYTDIASVSFYLQKTNDTQTHNAGIRYEGKDPDNYIQFNGTEEWRIIGTFEGSTVGLESGNQYTKIIRSEPLNMAFDSGQAEDNWDEEYDVGEPENDWTNSTLNTYLNGEYLQGLTDKTKIAKHNGNYSTWHLRGMAFGQNYLSTTNDWYMAERVTGGAGYRNGVLGDADVTIQSAIALMYPSDYGYAAYGEGCTREREIYNYESTEDADGNEVASCGSVDWLMTGDDEWLLSPLLGLSYYAFYVYGGDGGYVYSDSVDYEFAVRPVLYLEASVQIADGTGSQDDPYILK